MKLLKKFKNMFNNKVLLCDLDGTLIETISGNTFPVNEDDWKFKRHIKEAIQAFNPKYIFIISNQGGIEKGFITQNRFNLKLSKIMNEMRLWGDFVVDGTYCPSNDKENVYRKPNTGMVEYFKHDYCNGYDFDNKDALMIGDASGLPDQFSDSDIQCARNAGIRYADVSGFIWAMCPCVGCVSQCDIECPADISKKRRLKSVLL